MHIRRGLIAFCRSVANLLNHMLRNQQQQNIGKQLIKRTMTDWKDQILFSNINHPESAKPLHHLLKLPRGIDKHTDLRCQEHFSFQALLGLS
ncbi:hypothetical protein ATANTOWER_002762 [Ataeniobius toweri]|uniref:Uncharacterized protein n=1 Tax=Ataeniobius toweri TaxID=208326 RepID=A0ABU7BDM1_9TELE|nr:hypothetical protein [Ataeniobius toweri]